MKFTDKRTTILPRYAWLPLIMALVWNTVVYNGSRIFTAGRYHYILGSRLDECIPFVPWTIVIYFGCYLFWVINYILSVRQSREKTWRFLSADLLAKTFCLFFFLLIPTTNVRPQLGDGGIWEGAMEFLYGVDAADNLFPSIHCLTSWMCFIGVRGRRDIPGSYRVFSCVFALAVFLSTLTTRQHVIVDVIGGWALAEGCYRVTGHTRVGEWYGRAATAVNQKLGLDLPKRRAL